MFAITLTGLAFAAPAESPARPASIPERWLLKLMPKELPKLPEAFSKTTWTEQHNPRAGGGWIDWYAFAPEAGEVTVTRQNFRGFDADAGTKGVTVRTAPLAVHGVIVEYDRKLFTVALSEWKKSKVESTVLLNLGAAVEVRPNV